MSLGRNHKVFRTAGRDAIAEIVAGALRRALRNHSAKAKRVAAAIGATVRTAENLLEGRHAPSAPHLVALMAEFPEVTDAVLEMAGRNQPMDAERVRRAIALLEGRE